LNGIVAGKPLVRSTMDEVAAQAQRRIKRARETQAALAKINVDPSPENVAALHRVHAKHLREDGDREGAARAEARAKHAEATLQRPATAG
jgi:hypothetical protein